MNENVLPFQKKTFKTSAKSTHHQRLGYPSEKASEIRIGGMQTDKWKKSRRKGAVKRHKKYWILESS